MPSESCHGMTYREWLAGLAMQGAAGEYGWTVAQRAKWAVDMADALIEELRKREATVPTVRPPNLVP